MLIVATTFSWKFDAGEEDEPEDDVSPDCKIEVSQQMLCVFVNVNFLLIKKWEINMIVIYSLFSRIHKIFNGN